MIQGFAALGVGTYYLRHYAIVLGVIAALVVVRRLLARRGRPRLRQALGAVIVVLGVRLVLFDNPWVLSLYKVSLTTESLGMRQGGVLDLEVKKYQRDIHPRRVTNVAVGSSQVGAIFYHWTSDAPFPLVYSLAGMKPLDFVLHEQRIAARNPGRVILYLSAFDMTGSPELFSLPLAPPDPALIWPIYRRLRATGLTADEVFPHLHQYIGTQLSTEFRYAFVYRALLRQWFDAAPRPVLAGRLPEFSTYFDPQWLDYNFVFLRMFLEFCESRGIEVVIAEGQINPAAMTPEIAAIDDTVRLRIAELRLEFPGLRYIPRGDVYTFAADEFHDNTHVLPEAAERYTKELGRYLR